MDEDLLEKNEIEWLRRASRGDREAFDALFHAYYPMIFALAYNLIGRHHDAEEVVQEAFIKAARALPRFRGDSSFKTWLYRIATNTATDFRRRQRDTCELDETMAAPRAESDPMTEALRHAMESLSEHQRKSVVLTYFEGLTHAEAADVLDCAEATVSWRIFTARKKLKKLLSSQSGRRGGTG